MKELIIFINFAYIITYAFSIIFNLSDFVI
jgi:hypothetical protein